MPESISPVGAYAAAQIAFEGAILQAYGVDAHPAEGLAIGQREWGAIEAAFLEYRSAYTGAPLPAPGPNPLLHQAQLRAHVAIEWLMDFGEMTAAQAEAVTAITDALVLVSARLDEIEQAAR